MSGNNCKKQQKGERIIQKIVWEVMSIIKILMIRFEKEMSFRKSSESISVDTDGFLNEISFSNLILRILMMLMVELIPLLFSS